MCGIAGIFAPSGVPEGMQAHIRRMTDSLAHRGPDDADYWTDTRTGVALGHRRLSILDLSPLGRQPMRSACGRYTVVYNGEVFNHLDVRKELAGFGHSFRGGSDTETLLAAIRQWGVTNAIRRFIGMFAIALWDDETRSLTLVRDRLGIKPLYYGWADGVFLFGSELKAIRAYPGFDQELDRDALALYFRHNYIPAPHTVHRAARKLEPGSLLVVASDGQVTRQQFWSAWDVWRNGAANPYAGLFEDMVDELDRLLRDAVKLRMLSDVPLGAFLSGGIDSSTVVALMQAQSSVPVKTFSIGFHDQEYNEAEYAKAVAGHLGTDHTELYISPADLLAVVPDIPRYWDEPFSDSSQIPTYCVSRLAREHVTVSLSGDGGDELFSGYSRYFWTSRIWNALRMVPRPLRRCMAAVGHALPQRSFDLLGRNGQKIRWRLDLLGVDRFEDLYRYLLSHHKQPERFVNGAVEPRSPFADIPVSRDIWQRMSALDLVTYLPDDILTKVDRASMAVSLEARVPLLDHRVVEFAARIPTSMKVRNGVGKLPLRRVLGRYLPTELFERRKMGFAVPIASWLRTELRDWSEALLDEKRIREDGIMDVRAVRKMWDQFLKGETNWNYYLWDILMLQSWLDYNR